MKLLPVPRSPFPILTRKLFQQSLISDRRLEKFFTLIAISKRSTIVVLITNSIEAYEQIGKDLHAIAAQYVSEWEVVKR